MSSSSSFDSRPTYATILKHPQKSRMPLPPTEYSIIQTNSARFTANKRHVNGIDYFRLERNIVYALNNSQLLQCYSSDSANLCIFHMSNADISYLNSLTYQLVRLKDLRQGYVHYIRKSHDENNDALFFDYDRQTRIFNRMCIPIAKTDCIQVFEERVTLSINGLRIACDYHIYLDVSVYQVKVEEELDCIFE